MNHVIHAGHPAGIAVPPTQPLRAPQLLAEQRIESRLERLGDEIQQMVEAPFPGLLQDRGCIREAFEELTTKHTILLWTARVAKCTGGAVRERLWREIERALASLENFAASLLRG
jgi:hypothetical protein